MCFDKRMIKCGTLSKMLIYRETIVSLYAMLGYFLNGHTASATCPKYIGPMDIRLDYGVWIEKLPGSRVAYDTFPGDFKITPGDSITIDFQTTEPSGLIFLTGDFSSGDLVAVHLSHGYLTFMRKCGRGKAHEQYTKQLSDGKWHSLRYTHSIRGGELEIDKWNPFREFHLGPCSNFNSVLFGGLSPKLELHSWKGQDTHHRFQGCLRNMRIDGKIPIIHPQYVAVSACPKQ